MTQNPQPHYVRRFDSLGADDLGVAGGKGVNLGVLVDAGLPVPSGFVVTTAAYRTVTDDAEIREAIKQLDSHDSRDSGALATTATEIRSLIRDRPVGEPITRAIADALDGDASTTYAVRSSATAEDLATASFAGQHDTHLGVTADAIVDRVRGCMASLFTDRAVAYRARNGISHTEVEMAVVVQEMVDADDGRVCCSPLTRRRGSELSRPSTRRTA